jgi:hypothetical protein
MKKGIVTIAGFLVAIAVGIAIGYLGGRNNVFGRGISDRSVNPKPGEAAPERIGDNSVGSKPREAASDWREWKYPGSAEHDSSTWGGGQAGNARLPGHYGMVMTTQDDYEKVLQFYADKTGVGAIAGSEGGGGMKFSTGGNTSSMEDWFVLNDSQSPGGANQSRPVKAKGFAKRTLLYDLTMFVTRADNEKHTHVVLAYYPRQP